MLTVNPTETVVCTAIVVVHTAQSVPNWLLMRFHGGSDAVLEAS